jgi:hypothetical protein
MTLVLSVRMELQKAGVAEGAREVSKDIRGIGTAAQEAERQASGLAEEIASTGTATATAAQGIAGFGRSIDDLRARWEPLFGIERRYRDELGALDQAHRAGAIGAETLIRQQAALKLALDRATSSITNQAAAAKRAAETMVARQTITPDRGADIAAYGAELDDLRARFNPLFAAERQHAATLAEITAAERVGAISSAEAAAATARATAAHTTQIQALRTAEANLGRHTGAMRLNGQAAAQLSYQLNDVVVSLASGMNPLTVLLQQGSQITPIFGGIRGTMAALAGVMSGTTLGVTALAGGIGLAVIAGHGHVAAMAEASIAATGLGRAIGTSATEIDRIARTQAGAAGVSVSAAREMVVGWTNTGRIGVEAFSPLLGIVKDFAVITGTDATTAAKTLGEAMADPARGAEMLSRQMGLVDSSTARLVTRLAEQGRLSEAQARLTQALGASIAGARERTDGWSRAWDGATRAMSNYWETFRRVSAGLLFGEEDGSATALQARLKAAEARLVSSPSGSIRRADAEEEIAQLQRRIALEETAAATRDRLRARSADDRSIDRGRGLAEAGQNDETRRRQQIADELALLRERQQAAARLYGSETRETPAVAGRIAEATLGTADAIEARTRALTTWISESERARRLDQIDVALLTARDPVERAVLEAQRSRIVTAGQLMSTSEAEAAAERAYARALAETLAQTRGSIADIAAETAVRARLNVLVADGAMASGDAARELQVEAQTRPLVTAAARAEGAEKERLLGLAAELRAAIIGQAQAEKQLQAAQTITAGRDRIAVLQAEIALIGESEAVRTRAIARLQAEQEIRRQGLESLPREAAAIRAIADAEAEVTLERDRRRRASEQEFGRRLDQVDIASSAARDPVEKAGLEAQRARIQALSEGRDETEAAAAAERAYARAIGESLAQTRGSIADITADAAARTRVNALVASGALASGDAARELQIEAQTRQLLTAAARAEGAERERLLGLAGQLRAAITAQAEAEKQAQAIQDLRSGRDRIETLQTEISLVGAAEPVRARALALLEAEQRIRSQGLTGSLAEQIRSQARATADLTTALERQKAAWSEIQTTGGSAIDTIVEGFRTGKDVSQQLVDDLSKEFLKLAVSNPLKNAIFGQNLPTAGDVGGLLGGLFGGSGATAAAVPSAVGTASITAATVIVNGSTLGGIGGIGTSGLAGLSSSGIDRSAFATELANPAVRSRLFAMTEAEVGGQGSQAQQAFMETLFNRASARGMSLSDVMSDRGYFPASTFASADRAFAAGGLDAKYGDLFARVRSGSNLSSYATGNASGTVGFNGGPMTFAAGGERFGIEGPDASWASRLQQSSDAASQSIAGLGNNSNSAVDAISKLTTGSNGAAQTLTTSAGGISEAGLSLQTSTSSLATGTQSAFGQLLSGLGNGVSSLVSGLGSILGSVVKGGGGIFESIVKLFSGGFADGGYTGAGSKYQIAGVVHRDEVVWSKADVARAGGVGAVEAMRRGWRALPGYADGGVVDDRRTTAGLGYIGGRPSPLGQAPSGPTGGFTQTIINQSSASVSTREETDERGGRRQTVVIAEAIGAAITQPRSAAQRALKTAYGMQPKVTRR